MFLNNLIISMMGLIVTTITALTCMLKFHFSKVSLEKGKCVKSIFQNLILTSFDQSLGLRRASALG